MYLTNEEFQGLLVGKKILKIFISESHLKFETDKDNVCFYVEGDCCSHSYFHDFIGVEKLLKNGAVKSFRELNNNEFPKEIENEDKREDDDDSIKIYGYEIVTEDPQFGDVTSVLAFRNSSNGYYGGSMEKCESVPDDIPEIKSDWNV